MFTLCFSHPPLSSRKRLSFLKKISPEFAKAHFEVARGSPESNRAYCTKSDTRVDGPWEFGALPFGQGHRVDLDDAAEAVLATGNLNLLPRGCARSTVADSQSWLRVLPHPVVTISQ